MILGSFEMTAPVVLAPMAGLTDMPFRETCRECGANFAVAEMTASREDLRGRKKSQTRWVEPAETRPRVVQLLGSDPQSIADAARAAEEAGADWVDINMGCPAKKVLQSACGSALLKDEALVGRILEAAVQAVRIPVTLKTRTGWDRDHKRAPVIARIAESAGVAMIVVHGRTRADGFSGEAEYETIREVKAAVKIPVIANGDIDSAEKAVHVLSETGADGIMIGRAAIGRPWIFLEVAAALRGDPVPAVSHDVREAVIRRHMIRHFDYYEGRRGGLLIRRHLTAYFRDSPDPEKCLPRLLRAEDREEAMRLAENLFAEGRLLCARSDEP